MMIESCSKECCTITIKDKQNDDESCSKECCTDKQSDERELQKGRLH